VKKLLKLVNIWHSYRQEGGLYNRLYAIGFVCLGTMLLKEEELARHLEYGKQQLLLIVLMLTIAWPRQLSDEV